MLRALVSLVAPISLSIGTLFYFRELHFHFLYGPALASWIYLLLIVPPLALELGFTRFFEVPRHGWRLTVLAGLVVRAGFIAALQYLFVWETLRMKNTPDFFIPLIGQWPAATRIAWIASPWLSCLVAALLVVTYWLLTVRWRRFRLTTTVLLPALATQLLFNLMYFHPTSPLRMRSTDRPDFVEQVFPYPGHGEIGAELAPEGLFFAREVYVHPDDKWAVATFGATFGGTDIEDKQNLAWIDLEGRRVQHFQSDTIRRFHSECPDRLYMAPWHFSLFYEYVPGGDELIRHPLPEKVGGHPVNEVMFVYHACDRNRVYIANPLNPVLLVWDTVEGRMEKVIEFAGKNGIQYGDTLAVIARNPSRGTLYLAKNGTVKLIELDEESLEPRRFRPLPGYPYDLQVSPDGSLLYCTALFEDVIWEIDAETLEIVRNIPVPPHVRRVAFSPDGSMLFAASYLTGEIVSMGARDAKEHVSFFVSPKIEGMYVTKRFVYLLGAEGLFRVPLKYLVP